MSEISSQPPSVAGKNLLWLGFYDSWITDVDTGFRDSLCAFYYYGGFTALGEREPRFFREGVEVWRADAIRDFVVHGGGNCFGLELTLPHRSELDVGCNYRFDLPFASPPDVITINDRLVWRRESAVREGEAFIARFDWCADNPKAVVRLLVTKPAGELRFISQEICRPSLFALSAASVGPSVAHAPTVYALPPAVRRFPLQPLFRQWLDWNTRPAPWPRSIPAAPWATDPVGIVIDINGIGQYSFADQLPYIQHMLRCHRFGAAGIDGIFYCPMGGWPPQYTGNWPHEIVPGDLTPAEMDRFVQRNGIRHVILEWCQFGEWLRGNPHDFPDPAWTYYPLAKFFEGIDRGNIIQSRYPDVQVYLWVAEFRLPGAMHDPRNRIDAPTPADTELWHRDGSLVTYDLWSKWDRLLDGNRQWQEKARRCMKDPARTHFAIQCSSPFTGPAAVRGGADVVDTKSIHRQNVQCFVAAGRGCARTAGLKLQLEIDSYHSNSYNTLGPLEMEQSYRLFYAAGADMIYAQADLFALTPDKRVVPNEVGAGALRAVRWLRQHPRRGEQTAPFALLQGDAVHLNHGPDSLQTRDGQPQRYQHRPEQADFDVVTCLVPRIGSYWRCDYRHMFTGVPYGPFDIAPAEHAFGALTHYRLATMMGWHGMTPEQYGNISGFVDAGGTFFCALGHLRVRGEGDWERNGRALAADPAERFGVRLGPDGAPELCDAEVVVADADGRPLVTRKGGAFLVWREALQMLDADSDNRRVLEALGDLVVQHRVVRFDPADDYLETVFSRRDGLLFVHLFNHARLKQPCGLGAEGKVWRGTVWLDRRWALPGVAMPAAVRLSETMRVQPARLRLDADWMGIPASVNRHMEFVLADEQTLIQQLLTQQKGV